MSLQFWAHFVVDNRMAFGLPLALTALLIYATLQENSRIWFRYANTNRLALSIGMLVLSFVWFAAYQERSLFCYVIGAAGSVIGMLVVLTDYSQQRVAWSTERSSIMALAQRRAAAKLSSSSSVSSARKVSLEQQSERTGGLVSPSPLSSAASIVRQRQHESVAYSWPQPVSTAAEP